MEFDNESRGAEPSSEPENTADIEKNAPSSLYANLERKFLTGFFQFYYKYTKLLNTLMPSITLEGKKLMIPSNVYKPIENEQRYGEFIEEGQRVCDLGCGCGAISVFVAEKADSVVALDIGEDAVAATKANCEKLGCTNVVALKSDMFAEAEGKFDTICANPPFVEIPMKGESNQWATSVTFLTRLFSEGKEYLEPGGRIIVLYPKNKQGRLESLACPEGFKLVEVKPVSPKSLKLWLICALYMELFFNAHFFVFERN